jgi:hypothetical protein
MSFWFCAHFILSAVQGEVMASLRAAAAGDEMDSDEEPHFLEAAGVLFVPVSHCIMFRDNFIYLFSR